MHRNTTKTILIKLQQKNKKKLPKQSLPTGGVSRQCEKRAAEDVSYQRHIGHYCPVEIQSDFANEHEDEGGVEEVFGEEHAEAHGGRGD